jgi:integrase
VANHVEPNIGRTTLSKLTPHQIAGLYGDLLRGGLAPSTVRQVHAVLHSALKQAVRWNLLVRNPASAVDAPRVPRHRIDPLSLGQVEALLAEAEQDRLHALYVLAVTTGLRQGELLGLQWSDIDWGSAELRVRRQLMRGPEGFEFPEPKTASGRRVVSLPARAVDALRAHRSRQLEERLAAGAAWHDWDLVFCNTVGKPIEGQNLTRRSFKPLLARAGLPPIRFHDLRHTAATLLLAQNVHPKVVQERLGHSQIAVTMDTYSHVMPSMQREAADKLDAMLGG